LSSIAGCLLIATPDILEATVLNGHAKLNDRDTHNAKNIFNALKKIKEL